VPTLVNLRKAAKRWLQALHAGDRDARDRLVRAYPQAPQEPTLRDVQHALAREHGHVNWTALKQAVERDAQNVTLTELLTAAGKGDLSTVSAILDRHPGLINERGALGDSGLRTALHFGVGHEAIVRWLLARGADPNIRDEGDNAYPLHFAAERGDLPTVQLLIEHGAEPVGEGTTHLLDVLGWAVCFDYALHLDVARYLLSHGARHTLVSAVAMGDVNAIRALASGGADLNQRMDRTNRRRTPLHLAVVKRQPAALNALIELGANLDLADAVGLTPLDQAALDRQEDMTRRLIDAGASMTLPAAIVLERTDVIERLLDENHERLSTTDNRGWARLLVHASGRASARVLETLLQTIMRHRSGLSIVNMEDDEDTAVDGTSGYTPLHAAAFHGNNDAVTILLTHGANPRVRDSKYCGTPAGWAAYAGHHATANLILDGDIDIFDAINFDRADRVGDILDRDPGAIDRPFKAYASCPSREKPWWPLPDCTPLEWASQQQKEDAKRVLIARGADRRTTADIEHAERVVWFLQSACWDHHVHGKGDHRMHDRAAQRMLAQDPSLARDSIYSAIVCGNIDEIGRTLAANPRAAETRGGARGWTPILYLAYTRFTHPATLENALPMARLLLDHGAKPNDFYMAGDAKYSVLTGVAGEGEQDSPRQPYAAALFELLLERGAEPFDIQVLYDTHFSGDVLWWLQLVYKHTIDTPRGAAWRDPEWRMFDMGGYGSGARFLLEMALKKRDVALARWLLARGANPNAAPARDQRFPKRSLYELALIDDLPEIAALLAEHGAVRTTPSLDEEEQFVLASLHLDRAEAQRLLTRHPEYRQSPRALFEAARRDRADVIALLVDLGVDLEVQDATGKRALHEAAAHGALRAAQCLIERGAEIDARERNYDAPPIGWAAHGDRTAMVDLLSRHSRYIWTLCFRGYVDRVRALLREDPTLARVVGDDGCTPLWWLPDDEEQALAVAELLLAAGANPAAESKNKTTAAGWARRRGMQRVAARLEAAIADPGDVDRHARARERTP
jgi:ankyrin repeat protein